MLPNWDEIADLFEKENLPYEKRVSIYHDYLKELNKIPYWTSLPIKKKGILLNEMTKSLGERPISKPTLPVEKERPTTGLKSTSQGISPEEANQLFQLSPEERSKGINTITGVPKSIGKGLLRFGPNLARYLDQTIGFAGGTLESVAKPLAQVAPGVFKPYEKAGRAIKKWGLKAAEDIQGNVLEGQDWLNLPKEKRGRLIENLNYLTDPEWLAYNITDAAQSMAAMVAATIYAGPGVGMATAGAMEAGELYENLIKDGFSHERAATAALAFGAVVGVLNKVGLTQIAKKLPVKNIVRNTIHRLISGGVEAVTEYAEEPAEAAINAIARGKKPEEIGADILQSLKNIEVIPGSLVMGGVMAGKPVGLPTKPVTEPTTEPTTPKIEAPTGEEGGDVVYKTSNGDQISLDTLDDYVKQETWGYHKLTKEDQKELKNIREDIANGKIDELSPKYKKAVKKYGAALQGNSIKHSKRFPIAEDMIYGPANKTDIPVEIYIDGKKTTIYKDKDGRTITNTPILPKDPVKKQEEIKKLFKENAEAGKWYKEWNEFFMGFQDEGISKEELQKYIQILGVLSPHQSIEGNTTLFANTINSLEKNESPKNISVAQREKVEAIWNGELSAVDMPIPEAIKTFGRKVGPFIKAGLDYTNPDAVVNDRWMGRLFGYNYPWQYSDKSRYYVPKEAQQDVETSIKQAAKDYGITVPDAQARLWHAANPEFTTYTNAIQKQPFGRLPEKLIKQTTDKGKIAIHFANTALNIVRPTGKEDFHNRFSKNVQDRIDAETKANPYVPFAFAYGENTTPEPMLAGKTPNKIKIPSNKIYDVEKDLLRLKEAAVQRIKGDSDAAETTAHFMNAFSNIIKDAGYEGFSVPMGDGKWYVFFNEMYTIPEHKEMIKERGVEYKGITKLTPGTERGKMWNFLIKTKDGTIYETGKPGHAWLINDFKIPLNDIIDAGVVVKNGKHSWRSKIEGMGAYNLDQYKEIWRQQLNQMRRGEDEYLYEPIADYEIQETKDYAMSLSPGTKVSDKDTQIGLEKYFRNRDSDIIDYAPGKGRWLEETETSPLISVRTGNLNLLKTKLHNYLVEHKQDVGYIHEKLPIDGNETPTATTRKRYGISEEQQPSKILYFDKELSEETLGKVYTILNDNNLPGSHYAPSRNMLTIHHIGSQSGEEFNKSINGAIKEIKKITPVTVKNQWNRHYEVLGLKRETSTIAQGTAPTLEVFKEPYTPKFSLERGLKNVRLFSDKSIRARDEYVRDIGDAAALLSKVRKHAQEEAYTIFLDKDNKILDIILWSKGGTTGTVFPAVSVAGRAIKTSGIERVIFLHQHPGGTAKSSKEDRGTLRALSVYLMPFDIKTQGVIIAGTTYTSFNINGTDEFPYTILPQKRKITLPIKQRILTIPTAELQKRKSITTTAELLDTFKELVGDKDGILLTSIGMKPIAFLPFNKSIGGFSLKDQPLMYIHGMYKALLQAIEGANAVGGFIKYNGDNMDMLQWIIELQVSPLSGFTLFDAITKDRSVNESILNEPMAGMGYYGRDILKHVAESPKSNHVSLREPTETGYGGFTKKEQEQRFQIAKGANIKLKSSIYRRAIENLIGLKNKAVRAYEHLPRTGEFAQAAFELDRLRKQNSVAQDKTVRALQHIKGDLSSKERDIFTRYIILKDLKESATKGEELPFGFSSEDVNSELKRLPLTPKIIETIGRRTKFANLLKNTYIKAMKDIGFNVENKLKRKDYFRHQVIDYIQAEGITKLGTGKKLKTPTYRGFLKKRKGYVGDIVADYVSAESEVFSHMLYDIEVANVLKTIDVNYNKTKEFKAKLADLQKEDPDITLADVVKADPDYTFWSPKEGHVFYIAHSIPEVLANKLLTGALEEAGIKADDLHANYAMGGLHRQFIIKKELAATLDDLTKKRSPVFAFHSNLLRKWKIWQLTSPRRFIKYNFRNLTGDADGIFVGNPRVFKKVPQAVGELFNAFVLKKPKTALLQKYFERGGMGATLQYQEMEDLRKLVKFDEKLSKPKTFIDKINPWKQYWNTVRLATDLRESILRYAAFLEFREEMLTSPDGKPKTWGASKPEEIMSLADIDDRAYWMQNDLLGAYDRVSVLGQTIREQMYPFWSWKEVNFRRYSQIAKNAINDKNLCSTMGRKLVGTAVFKTPYLAYRVGKMAIGASFLWAMLQVYNNLVWPDEEEELPEDVRFRPHIIFGRAQDGTINYFSRLGALPDLLEWVGLDALPQYVDAWTKGRMSIRDIAKDMAKQPLNMIVSGAMPFEKTTYELLSRRSFFPEVLEPGTVRNRMRHIARSLGLEHEYDAISSKPSKPYTQTIKGLFIYSSDPLASAYYRIADRKRTFLKSINKGAEGFWVTPRGDALYNARMALRYKDKALAAKYMRQYLLLGGKADGIIDSLKRMDPLSGLNHLEQMAFVAKLDSEDRKALVKAYKFYYEVLSGK